MFDPRTELAHLPRPGDGDGAWGLFDSVVAGGGWWHRDCPVGHVTVGAVLVDPGSRSMACVLHPRFGRWMQPGGHVEPGDESLAAAAAPVVVEEVGVRVDPAAGRVVQLAGFPGVPCPRGASTWHLDVRVAWLLPEGLSTELVCSPESLEVSWLPLDALPEPHDEDLAALARLALALLGA